MTKLLFPLIAVAAVIAAPVAYARTAGSWNVLRDWNSDSCYAAQRGATPGETVLARSYSSEAQATAAIHRFIGCNGGDTGQDYQ